MHLSKKLKRLLALLTVLTMLFQLAPAGTFVNAVSRPEYTVKFIVNGSVYRVETVLSGGFCDEPVNPGIPEGMRSFLGWFNGATLFDLVKQPITGNLELTAKFSENYLVQYLDVMKESGGVVIHSEEVPPVNGKAPEWKYNQQPPAGYAFHHWSKVGTSYEPYAFNTILTDNLLLEPVFVREYVISFNTDGGSLIDPVKVIRDDLLTKPADPTKPGYTFAGWVTAPSVEYNFNTPVTGEFTLLATWAAATAEYTVVVWVEKPGIAGTPVIGTADYATFSVFTKTGATESTPSLTMGDIPQDKQPRILVGASDYYYTKLVRANNAPISGDGNTIIDVYLNRKVYNLNFELRKSTASISIPSGPAAGTYPGSASGINYTFTAKYGQDISGLWPVSAYVSNSSTDVFGGWNIGAGASIINNPATYYSDDTTLLDESLIPADDVGLTFDARWVAGAIYYELNYMVKLLPGEPTKTGDRQFPSGGSWFRYEGPAEKEVVTLDSANWDPKRLVGMTRITAGGNNGIEYVPAVDANAGTKSNPHKLYAYYTRDLYNIIYNLNGGSYKGDETLTEPNVLFGQNLGKYNPAVNNYLTPGEITLEDVWEPVRDRWDFDNWYLDSACTVPFDFAGKTMGDGDQIIFAGWKNERPITFTAIFHVPNGAGGYSPAYSQTGIPLNGTIDTMKTGVPYIPNQYVDGYGVFIGWLCDYDSFDSPNLNNITPYSPFPVTTDIKLYPNFSYDKFTVTYIKKGSETGNVPEDLFPLLYAYGKDAIVKPNSGNLALTGQTFIGWKVLDAYGVPGVSKYPRNFLRVTGNMVLQAYFVPNDQVANIIYDANFGDIPERLPPLPVEKGKEYPLYTYPETGMKPRYGWEFKGWSTNPSAKPDDPDVLVPGKPSGTIPSADDATYYAVWEQVLFTVIYKPGAQGTFAEQVNDDLVYGAQTPDSPDISLCNTGWKFKNWQPDVAETVTEDAEYVAQWVKVHLVRFLDDDGTVLKEEEVEDGGDATPPDEPTKTKHRFKGWDKPYTNITEDTDITAGYDPVEDDVTYTVTFVDYDGTVLKKQDNIPYGGDATAPVNPTRPKYRFTGWDKPFTNVTKDITVTAQYIPVHKVTFEDGDGNKLKEEDVDDGKDATPPKEPTKPGYKFKGWDKPYTNIKGDTVIKAIWEPIPYDITYDLGGGTNNPGNPNSYTTDQTPVTIKDPTRPGYNFTGWREGNTIPEGSTGPRTFTATWSSQGGGSSGGGGGGSKATPKPTATPAPTAEFKETSPPLGDVFITDHVSYIIGYPEGDVRPERNISRAEVTTAFYRLITDVMRKSNWAITNDYPDVAESDWHNAAISVMTKIGVIRGHDTGIFAPDAYITRAELAAVAARFARIMGISGDTGATFSDIGVHWAEEDIKYVASVGWYVGYENGTFRPDQEITRAEFMAIVNRMLQRVPETVDDILVNDMKSWVDNANQGEWYYIIVQEATNTHIYEYSDKRVRGMQFNYEFWTAMKQNPDWLALEALWKEQNTRRR